MVVPFKQTILVDAIRDLEREANFRPFEARARVFIIDDAEKLSSVKDNAANALLKTLEEPPESTHIILLSAKPLLLLSTIRSRCQEIRFGPLRKQEIVSYLTENLEFPNEDASVVAGLSRGSLGRAVNIDLDSFRDVRTKLIGVVTSCIEGGRYAALLRTSEDLSNPKMRDSYLDALTILQSLIHDIWSIKRRRKPAIVHFDIEEDLRSLANQAETDSLRKSLESVERLRENLSV